jgi:lipopolysaccharide biosynthesis glycosyltransferase
MTDKVRVFVGTDRSQLLAVKVLEHSIQRHTQLDVEVIPMLDLPIRHPQDPRNSQRTGFSFSRFCIPQLAGYRGKALYLDADMLVFQDIASLWNIPFDKAKIVIQSDIPADKQTTDKLGAPSTRAKQCSVMLLDCDRLDWDIEKIVDGLDRNEYDYDRLIKELCILNEDEIKYAIPFKWNSLEYYDSETCLIHYTDMYTQPWISGENQNGYLWINEVRMMLKDGALTLQELEEEIRLGYFRPSLIRDIKYLHLVPPPARKIYRDINKKFDKQQKFVAHKEVYEAKRRRLKAIEEYERSAKKWQDLEALDFAFSESSSPTRLLIFVEHVNATYYLSFHYVLKLLYDRDLVNFFVVSSSTIDKICDRQHPESDIINLFQRLHPTTVIFSRYGLPYGKAIQQQCQIQQIPTIYHIDDYLLEIPLELGEDVRKQHGNTAVIEERESLLANADLIYASTEYLDKKLSQRFPAQKVYHGIYAPYLESLITKTNLDRHEAFKFGYMGSKGHKQDLQAIVPAIAQILTDYPQSTFETFGTIGVPEELKFFGSRIVSHHVKLEYDRFLQHLYTLNWDLGLAPLEDTEFNKCKAPTKYVEYTACYIPTLASNLLVYNQFVDEREILLADKDDWYEKIQYFIDRPYLKSSLLENAIDRCRQQFDLEILAKQIHDSIDLVRSNPLKQT